MDIKILRGEEQGADYMMDVPKSVTPPLLLPGQSVLHVYPTPGHASVTLGLPSAPVRNEIQSGSGHAGRARALEAQ